MTGIIINGELHELVDTHGSYCKECSLRKQCKDAMDVCGFTYCSISGKVCNKEIFVNRGKITKLETEE